jgi:SAM-dependent methyltransferase
MIGQPGETETAVTMTHSEGSIRIEPSPTPGRRRITTTLNEGLTGSPVRECETAYPDELIAVILEIKGPGWICDEILREESADYVEHTLRRELGAYVPGGAMAGRRVLDFGCGGLASTLTLARMYPDATIIGTDFNPGHLRIARARHAIYKQRNIQILDQPSPSEIPDIGTVDLIVLSAVVEHMLPDERRVMLPKLWDRLAAGGVLFVSDTPHRWFPIEAHTTKLPLLNYQSDAAAYRRTLGLGMTDMGRTWPEMLRAGIRGSTEREIIDCLTSGRRHEAAIMTPSGPGIRSRADLWYAGLTHGRKQLLKMAAKRTLEAIQLVTGTLVTQNITLAVRKTSVPR